MNIRQLPARTPGWIAAFVLLVLVVNIGAWIGVSEFGHLRVNVFSLMLEAQIIGAALAILFVKG